MGKKGNWFTALKKAFTSSPKEKPTNVSWYSKIDPN
jgi:hypothetical protein